jgi:hypothetical protein
MKPGSAWNSGASCISILSAGITEVNHHARLSPSLHRPPPLSPPINLGFCCFVLVTGYFAVRGLEPRALHMVDKWPTSSQSWPLCSPFSLPFSLCV